MQHPMLICEKVIAPLHAITGCATFSCNDWNHILPVVVDQSHVAVEELWPTFSCVTGLTR